MLFLFANNHSQQDNFSYLNWAQLCEKVSTPRQTNGIYDLDVCKASSECIGAHDGKDKLKDTVIKNDNFTLLRADLDDTKMNMLEIKQLIESMGITSFIVHTTAKHQPETPRYRVYIELSESISLELWTLIEGYLSYVLSADDCAERPQQIMYLPFHTQDYKYHIERGAPLDLETSDLLDHVDKWSDTQKKKLEQAISSPVKPRAVEKLIGHQMSIIDLVNISWEWSQLLTASGYKKQGNAYLPPEATSKQAGAYVLSSSDGKARYYSHHSSDPCATGQAIDKFDFIVIRSYGGNVKEAMRDIASKHFPDVHKHNLNEWKVLKHNESVSKARSSIGGA